MSHQTSDRNEQLVLPLVALVNVTPGSTIACPGFSLTGRPIEKVVPSVVILYNNNLTLNNISVLDVHRHIKGNSSWSKRKFIGQELKDILRLIEQPPVTPNVPLSHTIYVSSFTIILLGCILIGATIITIWYIRHRHPQHFLNNFRLILPPSPTETIAPKW